MTNSLFSKKEAVDTPYDSNSFFSSPAFIDLHFSISWTTFSCLDSDDDADGDDADSVGAEDAVLLLELEDEVEASSFLIGVFPSARAVSTASTSSLFSKKDLVLIP